MGSPSLPWDVQAMEHKEDGVREEGLPLQRARAQEDMGGTGCIVLCTSDSGYA